MDRVQTLSDGSVPTAAGFFNPLQDRILGIAQMAGTWVTRPTLRAAGTAITDVYVGATAGLVIGTTTVLPAKTETALSGTLAANTWYYVYGYNSGGAIAYEISTTAPDEHLRHKSGDASRAYVGCFRTRFSTASVIPFRMEKGRYHWRWSKASDFGSVSGTPTEMWWLADTLTSTSAVDRKPRDKTNNSDMAPPHARIVRFRGGTMGVAGSKLNIGVGGDTGDLFVVLNAVGTTFDDIQWMPFEVQLGTDGDVRYQPVIPGTNVTAAVFFEGFNENT